MRAWAVLFGALLQVFGTHSFVIPDEVPSLLSVIYSNIPTIKKGTDSRLGWGFRLGDRADFQVLVELGPQTNTQPLGNQEDKGTSKRNSINSLSNVLYAQRQKERQQQQQKKQENQISDTEGGKWLQNWSKDVVQNQETEKLPLEPRPGLGVGEIDAKSVIPDDSMVQLEELYGMKPGKGKIRVRNHQSTTPKVEALDDVDLD